MSMCKWKSTSILGKLALKRCGRVCQKCIYTLATYDQSTEFSSHQYLQFQFMLYSILKAGLMLKQQQPTTSTENLHFYFHLTMKNLKQWWKCVSMLYLLSKPFILKFSVLQLPLQVNYYKCNKKLSFLLKKILNFENSDPLQIHIKW